MGRGNHSTISTRMCCWSTRLHCVSDCRCRRRHHFHAYAEVGGLVLLEQPRAANWGRRSTGQTRLENRGLLLLFERKRVVSTVRGGGSPRMAHGFRVNTCTVSCHRCRAHAITFIGPVAVMLRGSNCQSPGALARRFWQWTHGPRKQQQKRSPRRLPATPFFLRRL